jgi:hypothetical protein
VVTRTVSKTVNLGSNPSSPAAVRSRRDDPGVSRWTPPDDWSYALLLGLFLGDGCLSRMTRTWTLRISMDAGYPDLIDQAVMATQLVAVNSRVTTRKMRDAECVVVGCSWLGWPDAIPQHGPGRKHTRPIVLARWQQEIVDRHPWPFLRGLLHSDGCRTVNRFSTKLPSGRVAAYEYPRWFFSNLSADIRDLFCHTCEAVGVRWTQSNPRNISVAHRASVALLDEFVGLKG